MWLGIHFEVTAQGTKVKAGIFLQKIFNPNTISNALHVEMRNMLKVGARVVGACFLLRGALVELCLNFSTGSKALLLGAHSRRKWFKVHVSMHSFSAASLCVYICICTFLDMNVYFYIHVYIHDNSGWGRELNVWSFSLIRGVPTALREGKR